MSRFTTHILASVAAISLLACQPNAQKDGAANSAPISVLEADENVVYGTLGNGMKYAVMANDTPTKTASIRMRIDTGSLNETDEIQGLAHFLEHMAFNGSTNLPEGEMVKTLERYGLAFGADTNAYTSFDETVYMLDLPDVTEELFDVTLKIMRETASNLLLDGDAIDRERGVVQSEKRRRDTPASRAQLASLDFFLSETRIPSRLPIGTDEDLANMKRESFVEYYQGHYRPEEAFLVIVGDVEPGFVISKIEQYFGDWEGQGEALSDIGPGEVTLRGMDVGHFSDPDITTSVSISVLKPYTEYPDTAENRKLGLIEGLGNAILNRRLSTLARSEDAPFIAAGASYSDLFKTADIASLNLSSQSDGWEAALTAGEQELRRALEFGFTQAELDEQLANYRKSLEVSAQTATTRRTPSLASSLVSSFANESVFTTPQSSLERFEGYADDITPDAVWEAFKTVWEGVEERPMLYLNHNQEIDDPKAKVKAVFEASRAVPVEAPEVTETVEFAYQDFGKPGKVSSRETIEPEGIEIITFENGLRLNLKKTDFDKDSIAITASFGDGFFALPEDKPEISDIFQYVMSAGGLEAHSADELQRIFAGKVVGVNMGYSNTHFSLSGTTVPDNFRDQLNAMAAYLTAPGFRPEAESRYDGWYKDYYPTIDTTPQGRAGKEVQRLIRSGDPRYGRSSLEATLAVTTDDVKAWISPYLQNSPIEMGIVGDMDIEATIEAVAATFGALPERKGEPGDFTKQSQLTFPAGTAEPVTLYHKGEANRSMISVYWPSPDGVDRERSRRLGVLRRVFSNRLTDVIREEEGASYSPSGFGYAARDFPGYGYIGTSLDLKPDDVDRMFTVVDEIAADFKAGNISADEFDRAMTPILENLDTSLESNSYWMGVTADIQSDPTSLADHRSREAAYQNMTLEDIKPLAAQIFDGDKAFRVKVLPPQ